MRNRMFWLVGVVMWKRCNVGLRGEVLGNTKSMLPFLSSWLWSIRSFLGSKWNILKVHSWEESTFSNSGISSCTVVCRSVSYNGTGCSLFSCLKVRAGTTQHQLTPITCKWATAAETELVHNTIQPDNILAAKLIDFNISNICVA